MLNDLMNGLAQWPWALRGLIGALLGGFLFIWVPPLFPKKETHPAIKAGDGGSASVHGSGTAIGGAGGSVTPPAKSQ
jgi:hypothetical protein